MVTLPCTIHVKEVPLNEAKDLVSGGFESAVGHVDTASVFSEQLGVDVPTVRTTVALLKGEQVLVGQYKGPRLAEGATSLPDGASICWCLVSVE